MRRALALTGVISSPLLLALPMEYPGLVAVLFSLVGSVFMIRVPIALIVAFTLLGLKNGTIQIDPAFLLVLV